MPASDIKEDVKKVIELLHIRFPDARCLLDYENPFQLLISTVLAAQCTDERVNAVAKTLYKKYRSAADFVKVPDDELKNDIRSTGFYNNKAKSIKKCCGSLVEDYGGKVPGTMEELVRLAGVGRKTANVLLVNCFGRQGIIVDTHMLRVTQRIGLTGNKDADRVEKDLMAVVPPDRCSLFSHVISFHGRNICTARKPDCPVCPINRFCDYGKSALGSK